MLILYLISIALAQKITTSLQSQNIQLIITCPSFGSIYYALWPQFQFAPTLAQIKAGIQIPYGTTGWTNANSPIYVLTASNTYYSIQYTAIAYCVDNSNSIYDPVSIRLLSYSNGSKNMVIKLYTDTQPSLTQLQTMACSGLISTSRIVINNFITCSSLPTNIAKNSNPAPYLTSIYVLQDNFVSTDTLPDELTQQGAAQIVTNFISTTNVTQSKLGTSQLIDMGKIQILPLLICDSLNFSQSTMTGVFHINNTDGIIIYMLSTIYYQPTLTDYFNNSKSILWNASVQVAATYTSNFTTPNLTIGNDYILSVVAVLYPSLASPNSGVQQYPFIASSWKAISANILMLLYLIQ